MAHIKIVLVETSHPGNIGAVARAMKNMCLSRLCLVSPKVFPSAEATARASGADDVLAAAQLCPTLAEAIADCQLVIGASALRRTISWPELSPRECAATIAALPARTEVAIVFGRERTGLDNREMDLCQFLLRIPCNSRFSSLNLAAAAQIVCYELLLAAGRHHAPAIGDRGKSPLATARQMELFYKHLYETLDIIGFLHQDKSRSVMRRLRRIFNRARLDSKEIDILRGILRMSQDNQGNSAPKR